MPNAYDNCPCGSGQKFKWCCTPYWDKIERALDLYQQGQNENALRVMDIAVKEHPEKPQVWAYYAHVLFREGKMPEAEEKLQKAFEIEPNFGLGLLLKGMFRQSEGEIIGALLLFRKAAEAYPKEATDQLSQVYEMIARNELMLNRLVASRAALELAVNFAPGDQELRMQYEQMFGAESRMAECARRPYGFRPTAKPVAEVSTGKFSDVKKAYETLAKEVPADPAAHFNLGLVQSWMGESAAAVESLNKSLELEYDDAHAEETAALVEVLNCSAGMEADSDSLEFRFFYQVRDPNAVVELLQAWGREKRMLSPQSDESGQQFSCLLVEEIPQIVETGTTLARVVANVQVVGSMMRIWSTNRENAQKIAVEVRDRVQLAVGEPVEGSGPAQISELVQEAFAYPVQIGDADQAQQKMQDYAANYYENAWIHRPRKGLGNVAPIDAAGSKLMRKRLLGAIRFQEDCVVAAAPRFQEDGKVFALQIYDFDKLRHKLGIEKIAGGEAPPELLAAAKAAIPKKDFGAMSAADLGLLKVAELTSVELEDAMKAALKLDARELAAHFARTAVALPADPNKFDRYPLYLCLISAALSEGKSDEALKITRDGASYDATNNAGKRSNEFGLRLAQLLAKTGHADDSAKAFEDLLERNPDETRYYINAIETMLSAKQADKASAFIERGLEKAKSSGNRDLEGACREMAEAVKRLK